MSKNKPYEEINELYDFYGELLTDKQKQVIEYYYLEDYSLSEISDLLEISRSAILDNLKRSEKLLHSYEDKLKLNEKFHKRLEIYKLMDSNDLSKYVKMLKECD